MAAQTRKRPETWGAIRKLPSGRYQASYVGPDGNRHTAKSNAGVSLTFDTKTDARAWLTATRGAIARDEWESSAARAERRIAAAKHAEAHRFAAYASTWVAQRQSSKGAPLRPKTASEYRRQLAGGLSHFADDHVTSITPARVREWHSARAAVAPTSAGAEARLLRAILNTAIDDDILTKNPVPSALTRTTTGVAHRPPTLEELGVILDTIEPRFRLAVLLAAYAGLRISEWRALRRGDLVFDGNRFLVRVERQAQFIEKAWVIGPPKSSEGERIVALPTSASPDVRGHLHKHVGLAGTDLLFRPVGRSDFLHDRQFNDAWNPARVAAGVRIAVGWDQSGRPTSWKNLVREHDLRAFAGTLHAQSGATLRETMAFLGHSTTAAAMAYQHAADDRLREIADRMPLPPRRAQLDTAEM